MWKFRFAVFANLVFRIYDLLQFVWIFRTVTFFGCRHPFATGDQQFTGVLLPRIERFCFLLAREVAVFHNVKRFCKRCFRILGFFAFYLSRT